jgi:hypothetical protein
MKDINENMQSTNPINDEESRLDRYLNDVRSQRQRIVAMGDALSRGALHTIPKSKGLSPSDQQALSKINLRLQDDTGSAVVQTANRMENLMDELAGHIVEDVRATATRTAALHQYGADLARKSGTPRDNDNEAAVIDAEFHEVNGKEQPPPKL